MKEAFSLPLSGFDALRSVSQIAALQAMHYMYLSVVLPPLLGIASVAVVLDWREMAGSASAPVWINDDLVTPVRSSRPSWTIAAAWLSSILIDVLVLVFIVRRPTHMLDHTLTLHFIHLVLTTYYAASLPTSLFYWLTIALHAGITIVWAEQLSVKRELNRTLGFNLVGSGRPPPAPASSSPIFDSTEKDDMPTDRIELERLA